MTDWRLGVPGALTPLGRSGLLVGPVSFGAAPIGNLGTAVTDEEAESAVHAAWESGIRYFDVSPHYGIGLAEVRLGRALRNYPRDDYIVSTKVGRVLLDTGAGMRDDTQGFAVRSNLHRVFDYSRDGARRSLENSLTRLGLQRVDIVYVHDAESRFAEALRGAFPALEEMRSEGVITSYGAGMNTAAKLVDVVRETDSDVILAARTWTLADRSALSELLPAALQRNVSVIAAGALTGVDLADRTGRIARLCAEFGVPMIAVAVRFPLLHPAVAGVLLGMRSSTEVIEDVGEFATHIPFELWAKIFAEFGLGDLTRA